MSRGRSTVLGFALTFAIAVVAYQLHSAPIPPFSIGDPARHPIDAMLIAIVIGMVWRNTIGMSPRFAAGVKASVVSLMPVGIVLMGAKLDFFDVVRTSGHSLVISIICVVVALALTIWMCRRIKVDQK